MNQLYMKQHFRNPKRKHTANKAKSQLYDYYAGYSELFVEDVLEYLNLKEDAFVLDPWNGSGTTTHVSERKGFNSIGFDINPVMPIISNSRRINDKNSMKELNEIFKKSLIRTKSTVIIPRDPLAIWLSNESIIFFRRIEFVIQRKTLFRKRFMFAKEKAVFNELLVNPEASFYYVALFRTLKEILAPFKSSNPTWIKQPTNEEEKVNISKELIYNCF